MRVTETKPSRKPSLWRPMPSTLEVRCLLKHKNLTNPPLIYFFCTSEMLAFLLKITSPDGKSHKKPKKPEDRTTVYLKGYFGRSCTYH